MPDYHPPKVRGLIIGFKWGHPPLPPGVFEKEIWRPSFPPPSARLPPEGRRRTGASAARGGDGRGGVSAPIGGAVAIPAAAPKARSAGLAPCPFPRPFCPALPSPSLFNDVSGGRGLAPPSDALCAYRYIREVLHLLMIFLCLMGFSALQKKIVIS